MKVIDWLFNRSAVCAELRTRLEAAERQRDLLAEDVRSYRIARRNLQEVNERLMSDLMVLRKQRDALRAQVESMLGVERGAR